MNNVIISLGCSFLAGVGNWHTPSVIKWKKNRIEHHDLYNGSTYNFLNYSLGTQLARNLNFDEHHNFAIGGSSIKHQLHYFYERYSAEIFKNKKVLFYFGITYPQRNCTFVNNKLRTLHLDEERNSDFYQKFGELSKERIIKDTIMNQLVYIKSIKELCNANNWDLILHPMMVDKTYYYQSFFSNVDNTIWVDKWLAPNDDKYLAHCGHPNTDGYKIWADELVEYITSGSKLDISSKPNTETIYCKDYHEGTEIQAQREDFKQSQYNEKM